MDRREFFAAAASTSLLSKTEAHKPSLVDKFVNSKACSPILEDIVQFWIENNYIFDDSKQSTQLACLLNNVMGYRAGIEDIERVLRINKKIWDKLEVKNIAYTNVLDSPYGGYYCLELTPIITSVGDNKFNLLIDSDLCKAEVEFHKGLNILSEDEIVDKVASEIDNQFFIKLIGNPGYCHDLHVINQLREDHSALSISIYGQKVNHIFLSDDMKGLLPFKLEKEVNHEKAFSFVKEFGNIRYYLIDGHEDIYLVKAESMDSPVVFCPFTLYMPRNKEDAITRYSLFAQKPSNNPLNRRFNGCVMNVPASLVKHHLQLQEDHLND